MNTYIIGPDGTYFSIDDAIIVRVDGDDVPAFVDAMEYGVDEGLGYVMDIIYGLQADARLGWAVCDSVDYNA